MGHGSWIPTAFQRREELEVYNLFSKRYQAYLPREGLKQVLI